MIYSDVETIADEEENILTGKMDMDVSEMPQNLTEVNWDFDYGEVIRTEEKFRLEEDDVYGHEYVEV